MDAVAAAMTTIAALAAEVLRAAWGGRPKGETQDGLDLTPVTDPTTGARVPAFLPSV
jgi:hypothetical protein